MASDLYLVATIFAPLALACAIGWIIYTRSLPARDTEPDSPAGPAEDAAESGHDAASALPPQATASPAIRELAEQILGGHRRALSRGITLVESRHPRDRAAAAGLVQAVFGNAGSAIRIGISGPPGVGKSTFSEAIGLHAIGQGKRVAVLAVDPSSTISGGSILGDKTRMERLGRSDSAYIRPSPSGGLHGGIARGVRESVTLCEAAGFDVILIETMGVGQAELAVREVVDLVALLVQPGAGDNLQGIKRGIVEIADFILVNKADGDLARAAELTVGEYKRALRLMSPPSDSWKPEVFACSAVEGTGIDHAWERIKAFESATTGDGTRDDVRARQAAEAVWSYVNLALRESFREVHAEPQSDVARWEAEVRGGRMAPAAAAAALLDMMRDGRIATGTSG
ncbi:MAG: methylmalonyl Co-A mutase-associated GTPase MeaB [Rhodospirillales bacterium]|nr:methylmalonyl Co-A mutase-associated GTPase MeaB [Rhodospirillales bacterium]